MEFRILGEVVDPPPVVELADSAGRARGIRILFNYSQCTGPLTVAARVRENVRRAVADSGVTVLGRVNFRRFSDDTVNATADLSESHVGLGTYLRARHVSGEINMCHENNDNTELARRLETNLRGVFKPRKVKVTEHPWESE